MNTVIDQQAFDLNTAGDRDLQKEILALFFEQIGSLVEELGETQDDKRWFEIAHTIKGSARNIGAVALASVAEQAEALDRPSASDTRDSLLTRIQGAVADIEAYSSVA